jgi:hypothetical protein
MSIMEGDRLTREYFVVLVGEAWGAGGLGKYRLAETIQVGYWSTAEEVYFAALNKLADMNDFLPSQFNVSSYFCARNNVGGD